jgi:hypothetical protein
MVRGNPRSERCTTMVLLAVFGLLALFSVISIVMSAEEPGRPVDTHDNPLLWETLGRR